MNHEETGPEQASGGEDTELGGQPIGDPDAVTIKINPACRLIPRGVVIGPSDKVEWFNMSHQYEVRVFDLPDIFETQPADLHVAPWSVSAALTVRTGVGSTEYEYKVQRDRCPPAFRTPRIGTINVEG